MSLKPTVKKGLYKAIENLEDRIQHLYLDSKGKVTVGIGHLVPNRSSIVTLIFHKTKKNLPSQIATTQEKQAEYDKIAKLPWGAQYGAHTFKQHTSLVMKDLRTLRGQSPLWRSPQCLRHFAL